MKWKKEALFINEQTFASLKEAARYLFLVNGTACNIFIVLDVLKYKISILLFAVGLILSVMFFLFLALIIDSTRENTITNGIIVINISLISFSLVLSLICFISDIIYTLCICQK